MQKKIIPLLVDLSWVRIIFFTIITLVLSSVILEIKNIRQQEFAFKINGYGDLLFSIQNRLDPILFKPASPSPDKFRLIWISDSSVQIFNETDKTAHGYAEVGRMPASMLRTHPTINNKELEIIYYPLWGTTSMEKYFATIHALQQFPDAILLSLNLSADFNKYPSFSLHQTPASTLYFSTQPEHVKNSLIFAQPADIFWITLANVNIFKRHATISAKLNRIFKKLNFVKLVNTKPVTRNFPSFPFFRSYIELIDSPFKVVNNHPSTLQFQINLLSMLSYQDNDILMYFYKETLNTLADTKIPTYVYAAPVNLEIMNQFPEIRKEYDNLLIKIEQIAAQYRSSSLVIDLYEIQELIPNLKFFDVVHLRQEEPFTEYLWNRLSDLAQQTH